VQAQKPGLTIRKKPADVAQSDESGTNETDAEGAAPAPSPAIEDGSHESDQVAVATPEPAPAEAEVAQLDPELQRVGKATPGPSRLSTQWRNEVAPPAEADPRQDDARASQLTDPFGDAPMPSTDDFGAMFESNATTVEEVFVGDRVRARVVSINDGNIFVDLGAKAEGVVSAGEFIGADGEISIAIGDEIDTYVTRIGRNGIEVSTALGRRGDGEADAEMLMHAQQSEIPIEGKVTAVNKGGYDVDIAGARGFCPFSQIDLNTSEPETHIGQTYRFLVQRVEEGGRNVVVSRSALLRAEREAAAAETLAALGIGDVCEGVVTRVEAYGAFVDIGGVDGLIHVSELSWERHETAAEVLSVGDRVRVKVLRVDDADNPRERRIALSLKALAEDPWISHVARMQVGDAITGVVSKLERFGAFIELAPGIDGLVHISEVARGKRINHPREVLEIGQHVEVLVMDINPLKRQIGLSMKALEDDPWAGVATRFPAGMTVQGVVENVQTFGVFVALPGGLTGLIPMSHLEGDESKHVHTRMRPGTEIEARVLDVDAPRRRITLTRRTDDEAEGSASYAAYQQTRTVDQGGRSLGTLGDLLARRKSK